MKRLLIVADHSLVAHAIRLALKQTAGFQVVGVVDGRDERARDALLEHAPGRRPRRRHARPAHDEARDPTRAGAPARGDRARARARSACC